MMSRRWCRHWATAHAVSPPPGKWHLGLNCHSSSDHCHHPLSHGFQHFLGMPLGMMGDCAGAEPSEKRVALQRRLHLWGQACTLAALTLAAGRLTRLLRTPWWMLVLGLAALAAVFLAASRHVGDLIIYADCFLMRNHTVTQQPLRLERVAGLMLREAETFLQR